MSRSGYHRLDTGLYIEHNTDNKEKLADYYIVVAGAGRETILPKDALFINTVVTSHNMVWHIYITNIIEKETSCGELHVLDS